MTKIQQSEREQAIASLRETLKPGDTVYTILRHVSRSGMQRVISLHVVEHGEIRWITGLAAKAMGDRLHPKLDGIVISGCGMDMGFALVYNLGRVLFPDGFKVTGHGRNGDTSGHDRDGGYALQQRWL